MAAIYSLRSKHFGSLNKMYKFSEILVRNLRTSKSILQPFTVPLPNLDRKQQDEKVLRPFMHIQRAPSKFHMELYRSFNYWFKVPENKLKAIEEFIQTFHTATLMIDDIQDNSTFRYEVPVAHVIYSLALTINAASHAMALATEKILALEPKAVKIYLEAVIEAHRGQGIDIYWRDNLICPSEAEYIDMIRQKTSVMFVLAYRLQQLFSDQKGDYTDLANLIGIYYQIRDDYCNLLAVKHTDNKTYCSDITEGKFSLPIIHALQHPDTGNQVLNILKQRTQDPDLKAYCISILKKAGSFQYTNHVLTELETDILDQVKVLGGNPKLAAVMDGLANWRQHIKN